MIKNADSPAMPCGVEQDSYQPGSEPAHHGLTKREHFAAMAMQGILSNEGHNGGAMHYRDGGTQVASVAVSMADALLRKLEDK